MKATQDKKPTFDPITITLETYEEAEAFKLMANVSTSVAAAVAQDTTSYPITKQRQAAIKNVLFALWQTTPFYNLELKKEDS